MGDREHRARRTPRAPPPAPRPTRRSRLSVGSSSSSSVAPDSSSSRIWNRACWPPRQRLEPLLGRVRELVAVQHPGRRLPRPIPSRCVVAAVQDLQQGAADQLGVLVGLHEPARPHPRAELGLAGVRHRRRPATSPTGRCSTSGSLPPAASSRRKCDLPEPLEPSTATRSPYQTSRSNGFISPVSSSSLADHRALAGAAALEPHLHLLLARAARSAGRPPRTCAAGSARPGSARPCRRCTPPSACSISTSALSFACSSSQRRRSSSKRSNRSRARLVVGREAARVRPHRCCRRAPSSTVTTRVAVLSSSSRSWQMKRIVLARLADPLLEPALAGHVEVVVRLVEQQHLVGAAQQQLQHQPLLLAAGQRARARGTSPGRRAAPSAGRGADVPDDLDVVAAGVGPLGQRLGVAHLGLLVVGVHQRQLARRRPAAAASRTRGGATESSRSCDGLVASPPCADELPHHAEAAGAGDRAGVRREVAGDDPQQRGLAGAVGADQRDLGALADPERDVVEQHPPVRQLVAHSGDVHVSHVRQSPPRRPGPRDPIWRVRRFMPRAYRPVMSMVRSGPGRRTCWSTARTSTPPSAPRSSDGARGPRSGPAGTGCSQFARERWDQPARGLFFLAANNELPMTLRAGAALDRLPAGAAGRRGRREGRRHRHPAHPRGARPTGTATCCWSATTATSSSRSAALLDGAAGSASSASPSSATARSRRWPTRTGVLRPGVRRAGVHRAAAARPDHPDRGVRPAGLPVTLSPRSAA